MTEQELKELQEDLLEAKESSVHWFKVANESRMQIEQLKLQLECVLIAYKQLRGEDNE